MKIVIIILLLTLASVVSCEPPMPPTDEEMIRHFATHEAAFDKIRKIMAESSEGSFHYPPLSPCDILILDSAEQISYQPNQRRYTGYQDLTEYNSTPCCQRLDAVLSLLTAGSRKRQIRYM